MPFSMLGRRIPLYSLDLLNGLALVSIGLSMRSNSWSNGKLIYALSIGTNLWRVCNAGAFHLTARPVLRLIFDFPVITSRD